MRHIALAVLMLTLCMPGNQLFCQAEFVILTPDSDINREIAGGSIFDLDFFQFAEDTAGLTLNPMLPPDWNWVAGKGVASDGRPVEFFFHDGIMFATEVEESSFRLRKYSETFTGKIQSNAFVIGLRRKAEAVIFIAADEAQEVRLVVDASVFGEEKVIELSLAKNEGQIVRIFPLREPYRP